MPVGGARIIDIADEKHPRVVSTIKLEVNTTTARAGEQSNDSPFANRIGYTGHYCAVPSRADPGVVACSFVSSGLRLFDIRMDYRVFAFGFFAALLTGILAGIIPALRTSRADLAETLKAGGRSGGSSASHNRWRNALVVAQLHRSEAFPSFDVE